METRLQSQKRKKIEKGEKHAEETEKEKFDFLRQSETENRGKKRSGDIAEGPQKRQKIESQRPETEKARIEANTALLEKYRARYTTKVDFLEFDENGHTVWEISTTVKGHQAKSTGTPYRNELIPETGTLIGGNNNTRHDRTLNVDETKALHLSEILYCQIEEAKVEIRDKAAHLPELEGCDIPDFDLKKCIGNSIVNKPTRKRISDFLGEKTSQTYKADSDSGFDAFADAPTTESKLRLAHHYNKDCTSIKIVKGDPFPGTEYEYSDRKPLPEQQISS